MSKNTLQDILDRLLAAGLLELRERAVVPRMVNRDYDGGDQAKLFDTVDVPIPSNLAAAVQPQKSKVQLDHLDSTTFEITDVEMKNMIDAPSLGTTRVLPQVIKAARTLGGNLNRTILELYRSIWNFTGIPGVIPFSGAQSSKLHTVTNARKILNSHLAPAAHRTFFMNEEVEKRMTQIPGGPKPDPTHRYHYLGADWFAIQDLPFHTAGSAKGYKVVGASVSAMQTIPSGTKTIHIAGGTGDFAVGDIVFFEFPNTAGVQQSAPYVIRQPLPPGSVLLIEPGLQQDIPVGSTIEVAGSHRVNILLHRDAITFACRSITTPAGMTANMTNFFDPNSGLTLNLEMSRMYNKYVGQFNILWGCKLERPELACRIAGEDHVFPTKTNNVVIPGMIGSGSSNGNPPPTSQNTGIPEKEKEEAKSRNFDRYLTFTSEQAKIFEDARIKQVENWDDVTKATIYTLLNGQGMTLDKAREARIKAKLTGR